MKKGQGTPQQCLRLVCLRVGMIKTGHMIELTAMEKNLVTNLSELGGLVMKRLLKKNACNVRVAY
jgi:hypothetical protein